MELPSSHDASDLEIIKWFQGKDILKKQRKCLECVANMELVQNCIPPDGFSWTCIACLSLSSIRNGSPIFGDYPIKFRTWINIINAWCQHREITSISEFEASHGLVKQWYWICNRNMVRYLFENPVHLGYKDCRISLTHVSLEVYVPENIHVYILTDISNQPLKSYMRLYTDYRIKDILDMILETVAVGSTIYITNESDLISLEKVQQHKETDLKCSFLLDGGIDANQLEWTNYCKSLVSDIKEVSLTGSKEYVEMFLAKGMMLDHFAGNRGLEVLIKALLSGT